MNTNHVDQKIEEINSIKLFDLAQVSRPEITALNNVIILNSSNLQLEERTVKGSNLNSNGAFIAIWKGLSLPNNIEEFVGRVDLTSTSSGGEWAPKEITVEPGINLKTGFFTIGLFLQKDDLLSLGAQVNLMQGTAQNVQPSSIFVVNPTNTNIPVNYSVPNLVNPQVCRYLLKLYEGEGPFFGKTPIAFKYIDSGDNVGITNFPVKLSAGTYTVQLNPGVSGSPYSATYTFKLS
ncbi:hypothetical protein [Aureivirga marina]|uniref:hypothetical protein n=1 Tax=Aureivirga marina TaxID=1182451 RepID=UPI0018CBEC75|nr:hypothetical protein [Aureivirga marina]